MTLWLIFALMTLAALAAIVWPFTFDREIDLSGRDTAVYQDQLLEIDRDREAGLIGPADAEAARVEVSRRLLRAAEVSNSLLQSPTAAKKLRQHRLAILATALVLLPTLAAGTYLRLGSPAAAFAQNIADQTTSSSDDALIDAMVDDAMVDQVEGHLKDKPNDGRGWEALAPVYKRLGRYEDSARAWQNAIANLGDSADREANLGESFVAAANGLVTEEARRAFDRALSIDHSSVDARFYIGLAAKQAGRRDEAARIWRDLIATAAPDSDWIDTVRDALARLDQASVAATDDASTPEKQKDAMIMSMVEGLSERLKTNGGDLDGWLRLVRSYNVLGERDKADSAIKDARRALASDPDKSARFEQGLNSIDRPLASGPEQVPRQSASTTAAPPEHDNATMQGTVDKLAERLRSKGGDVDSWLMLVRSYQTLGEPGNAAAAIAQARLAFTSDQKKLSRFDQLMGAAETASSVTSAPEISQRPETQKPTRTDVNSADDQTAMIKGMVDRLAERLKRDGHDVDGWIQPMRSYVVLGQRDQASAAGQGARLALGNDAEGLRRLSKGAKELGVNLP